MFFTKLPTSPPFPRNALGKTDVIKRITSKLHDFFRVVCKLGNSITSKNVYSDSTADCCGMYRKERP